MMEKQSTKRPWSKIVTLLALVPPLVMVPASIIMGCMMVFAVPGNPTPLEVEGFSRIWHAFWRYPFVAGPLLLLLVWQILLSKAPSKTAIFILLSSTYAVFITAWAQLIYGWQQMFPD